MWSRSPTRALAFVKEDLRMFTPPCRAALPIFTDEDSKPHAGATVAVVAALAQLQHAITQFVAHYPRRWWRGDRRRSRRRAILRRNGDPRSVATLLIASLLVITIAPWPRLALRSDGRAGDPAHDRADCGPAPAAQCSANDPPVTPPWIAPPTGSCAAASSTGAAMAMDSKAAAPKARYIFSPLE